MIGIKEKIFVSTGFHEGNVGFIRFGEGVILVDLPPSPPDVEKWLREIESLNVGPFFYLVVTDCHPLRLLGLLLKPPVPRIAHHNFQEELLGAKAYFKLIFKECYQKYYDGEPPENLEIFLPTLAFRGVMTLHRGRDTIKLLAVSGPTPANLVVYLPRERVLFAGAMVVRGMHPDLRLAHSGKWIANLKRLKALPVETVIPGYGDPCGPEAFDEMIEYLTIVRNAVKEFYQAGKGRPDVSRLVGNLLPLFPYPQDEEVRSLFKAGLSHLYDEIKAEDLKT